MCSCGRVAFDANGDGGALDVSADGLTGHDEDGDGLPDAFDACPHVADDGTDSDGDTVGDACDPEPSNSRQFWVWFEPFIDGVSTHFGTNPPWIRKADSIECPAQGSPVQLVKAMNLLDADVVLGVDTIASPGGHNFGIVLRHSADPTYSYAELFGGGGLPDYLEVMEYDGTSYNALKRAQLGPTLPIGAGFLRLHANASGVAAMTIDGGFGTSYTSATNATPSYTGADILVIAATNIALEIRYVAIIGSNPP